MAGREQLYLSGLLVHVNISADLALCVRLHPCTCQDCIPFSDKSTLCSQVPTILCCPELGACAPLLGHGAARSSRRESESTTVTRTPPSPWRGWRGRSSCDIWCETGWLQREIRSRARLTQPERDQHKVDQEVPPPPPHLPLCTHITTVLRVQVGL